MAARIRCGAKKGTSHEHIYTETWLEWLVKSHKREAVSVYDVQDCELPSTRNANRYLLQRANQRTFHHLRGRETLTLPRVTSAIHQKSFFPEMTKRCNKLPDHIKACTSIEEFKQRRLTGEKPYVPAHYSTGARNEQIIICQ